MTKCNNCMFMCKEKTNEERIKCKDFISPKNNKELENQNKELIQKISELEEQIEKMKCFIHSEIDFCTYCPLTNECRNYEGTCPYAYATEEEQINLLMDFIQKWELAE